MTIQNGNNVVGTTIDWLALEVLLFEYRGILEE
jgi:hypothetical protein